MFSVPDFFLIAHGRNSIGEEESDGSQVVLTSEDPGNCSITVPAIGMRVLEGATAVLLYGAFVVVCGGIDIEFDSDSIACSDFTAGFHKSLPSLLNHRSYATSVALGDALDQMMVIVGGTDIDRSQRG